MPEKKLTFLLDTEADKPDTFERTVQENKRLKKENERFGRIKQVSQRFQTRGWIMDGVT